MSNQPTTLNEGNRSKYSKFLSLLGYWKSSFSFTYILRQNSEISFPSYLLRMCGVDILQMQVLFTDPLYIWEVENFLFDVMFIAVLFVTAVGIPAEELVLVIEISFHLFMTFLGCDRGSPHLLDYQLAAKAVLGREHTNMVNIKGSLPSPRLRGGRTIYSFPSRIEIRFNLFRSPL